jgi:hypothetical protein
MDLTFTAGLSQRLAKLLDRWTQVGVYYLCHSMICTTTIELYVEHIERALINPSCLLPFE